MYIIDSTGAIVVQYTYDPWGYIEAITGTLASTIGTYNPIRYKDYYYDTETGFYYCRARYYDPEICRWINADDVYFLGFEGDLISYNLFSYCGNNPIMGYDYSGNIDLWRTLKNLGTEIIKVAVVTSGIIGSAGIMLGAVAGTFMSGGTGACAIPVAVALATTLIEVSVAVAVVGVGTGVAVAATGEIGSSATAPERKTNVNKQDSKIFKRFKPVKGKKYRTLGNGKNQRYYEWDYTHNDIEVYDRFGKHLGSMDPVTGEMYKEAVKGRILEGFK